MTNEEQSALWAEYVQTRNRSVRDMLVEMYLPLSRAVAHKFSNRGLEDEDLEQIAAMALLKAVEHFLPEKGFRFVTYAVPEMAGAIRHALRDRNGTFKLPRNTLKLLGDIAKQRSSFEQCHFRSPTAQELAEQLHVAPEEIISAMYMQGDIQTVSMDQTLPTTEDGTLALFLGAEEKRYAEIDAEQRFQWALQQANEQERQLMHYRYREALNQRETAVRLGVSQMQVSRMERRLLQRLRKLLENDI